MMSGNVNDLTAAEKDQTDLYELFHKEGNQKLHDQLFLRVAEKTIITVSKAIKEAKERGETNVSDPEAAAYFFVFGQMGILMSNDIPEKEKTKRIQACLIDLLGLE
jgi:hypothetical protein